MEALHRSAIRSLALLMTVLLTEIALGAGQSVTAVSARPCRVVNVTQGKHFPPDSGGALAAAIVAANADDQLTITGICTGTYTLDQHIALTGVATQQFPIPTIDGGQSGSTLSVATGVTAIPHGPHNHRRNRGARSSAPRCPRRWGRYCQQRQSHPRLVRRQRQHGKSKR